MPEIAKQTIDCYLTGLADRQSAPGGGAAAAITAGQGAALLCMVLNLTVGRRRYKKHDELLQPILFQCESLVQVALQYADLDAVAFKAVMHCYDLPKSNDKEENIRSQELEKALLEAAEVPLRLLHICQGLLQDAKTVGEFGNRTVLSDVIVATHLLRAAAYGCETNIRINLKSISPSQRRADLMESAEYSMGKVKVSVLEVLGTCQSRLGLPT